MSSCRRPWTLFSVVALTAFIFAGLSVAGHTQGQGRGGNKEAGPLRVVDDLGTEVGFYVGIANAVAAADIRNGMTVRLVDGLWVLFPVTPDSFGVTSHINYRLRYETQDCNSTPYMLPTEYGEPQLVRTGVGGWMGVYYYYSAAAPVSITERAFRQFSDTGLGPCSGIGFIARSGVIEATVLDMSGLFLPPFTINQ